MPQLLGSRCGMVTQGTYAHTLLVYAVSEPGEWTPVSVAEDLDGNVKRWRGAASWLRARGLIKMPGRGRHAALEPTALGIVALEEICRRSRL